MSVELRGRVAQGEFVLQVDLAVPDGGVVAVLGPNGAGKTTLLRTLAGLVGLDEGRLALDGRTVDEPGTATFVPPERRGVGMVFQDHLLLPHLDAAANVAFGLRVAGRRRADAERAARGWLDRVGVGDLAGARPGRLSGGQAQRVALARALAPGPRLLLLDEPFAALDVTTRADIRRDLRHLLDGVPPDERPTVVLVSHDPLDAFALARDVVVLDHGRCVQSGGLAAVTARPRSRFVADLLGANLLRGTATGHRVVLDDGGTLEVADAVDGAVFVLVPPRAIAVALGRPEGGSVRNRWPARVTHLEPLGDRVRLGLVAAAGVEASAGPGPGAIVAEVTASAAAELGLAVEASVWASLKATEVDVYPA